MRRSPQASASSIYERDRFIRQALDRVADNAVSERMEGPERSTRRLHRLAPQLGLEMIAIVVGVVVLQHSGCEPLTVDTKASLQRAPIDLASMKTPPDRPAIVADDPARLAALHGDSGGASNEPFPSSFRLARFGRTGSAIPEAPSFDTASLDFPADELLLENDGELL